MSACVFCRLAAKEIPADIIYENDQVICFLPEKMEVFGHTLIVPKKHYADLYDIPESVLAELIGVAKKLALSYRQKINATGMNLLHASGRDGQQTVFHFHFHLLPRFRDDGLNTWPKLATVKVSRRELAEKLREK